MCVDKSLFSVNSGESFQPNGPRGTSYSEYEAFHSTLAKCNAGSRGEDKMMKVLLPSWITTFIY